VGTDATQVRRSRTVLAWALLALAGVAGNLGLSVLLEWGGTLARPLLEPMASMWPDAHQSGQEGLLLDLLLVTALAAIMGRVAARLGLARPLLASGIVVLGSVIPELALVATDLTHWTLTSDRYVSPFHVDELAAYLVPAHAVLLALLLPPAIWLSRRPPRVLPITIPIVAACALLVLVVAGALRWHHPAYLSTLPEVALGAAPSVGTVERRGPLCVYGSSVTPDWDVRSRLDSGLGDELSSRVKRPLTYVAVDGPVSGDTCQPGIPVSASWALAGDTIRFDAERHLLFRKEDTAGMVSWQELRGEPVLMRQLPRRVRTPAGLVACGVLAILMLAASTSGRRTAGYDPDASWFTLLASLPFALPLVCCAVLGYVL
jgi:hypothetical protein